MRARRLGAGAGVVVAALPSVASACAGCLSSAFGDRTFNWPYLGLIVAPFIVAAVVAGVLAYHYGDTRAVRLALARLGEAFTARRARLSRLEKERP